MGEKKKPRLLGAVTQAWKLLELVEYWLLNLPVQVEAWLDHITRLGAVDQPTAVYLKALLEGGRIGPERRAGYRLPTHVDDFASADEGAKIIRETLIARGPNSGEGEETKARTMPEILALQFYGNESGLRMGSKLTWYATDAEGAKTVFPKLGVDWNTTGRAGTFDAVHAAFLLDGPSENREQGWVLSRGWGLGQETEGTGKAFGGLVLRHGLPIIPLGSTHIEQPAAFVDKQASLESVLEHKVLGKFNNRYQKRRDCSFQNAGGAYYDCHSCIKRFFDLGLVGTGDGDGAVFVPTGDGYVGRLRNAAGFFVDLERVTAWAREGGADGLAPATDYEALFGLKEVEPPSDDVRAVLRSDDVVALSKAVDDIAEERGLDRAVLAADVQSHIDERRDLPCSWFRVRIGYTGSGPQAWGSLFKMMRVVGELKSANKTCKKHIIEASKVRRGEVPE